MAAAARPTTAGGLSVFNWGLLMFSSKSAQGFFDPRFNASIPPDAVEISTEYHAELLDQQTAGKVIVWRDDSYPMLVDPPPPSVEQLAGAERAWRDRCLYETDGVVARHRDEVEEGVEPTLTSAQYVELQRHRRSLRAWPEAGEFPLSEHRPTAPPWLAVQIV